MSKAVKKLVNKARKGRKQIHEENECAPLNESWSPRSIVEGASVNALFRNKSAFNEERISPPLDVFDNVGSSVYDGLDLTEEPSDGDYGLANSFFHDNEDQQNLENSHFDFSGSSANYDVIESADAKATPSWNRSAVSHRSRSVQRPMQRDGGAAIVGIAETERRRARSTGRADPRQESIATSAKSDTKKPKKSKIVKIRQLQDKNQRYKDEFRKVQKDRKLLKKQLEIKNLETAALKKEIDSHIAETSQVKKSLAEALLQLDRNDHGERKDRSSITVLQKELKTASDDYTVAVARMARSREEVEELKVSLERKDAQIQSLTDEVTTQAELVDSLHLEVEALHKQSTRSCVDDERATALQEENTKLDAELKTILESRESMCKEREEAIAELLKENEDMKRLLNEHRESENPSDIHRAEVEQIRSELAAETAALEEAQDRSVLLEEEIEAWLAKGEEMESDIVRLRDDVEAWQRKASAAEETISVVEATARDSAKMALAAETALAAAEKAHMDQANEQDRRHTEALLDQKASFERKLQEAEKHVATNPQETMLQKAVDHRNAKKAAKGGWGVMQRLGGNNETEDELSVDERKIRELQATNADQEEEITKVKSELVKLRSSCRNTEYENQKRIDQLLEENRQYAAKQQALELELAALKEAPTS